MATERTAAGLGELEGAVLEAVWEQGEATVRELYARVGEPRRLAYTTILTVVQRLTKKGLLVRQPVLKPHTYTAAVDRDALAQLRAQELAGIMVHLGKAGAAAFIAEAQRLDPEWVAGLRARLHRGDG
jgi:predicted transcriptional regulator